MRRRLALTVALALAACHAKPDPAKIQAAATEKLQQQIDGDFGKGKATVGAIQIVDAGVPHYEGSASIKIGDRTISLPIRVSSDGTTTLVEADDGKVGDAIKQASLASIASLDGKYSDYVLSPSLFARLPADLRADPAKFKERLGTVEPVVHEDGGYFGSGCLPHSCTTDAAGWFISDDGSKTAAIVLETDEPTAEGGASGFTAEPNFRIYGTSRADMPAPLASWASDLGMNDMNIGGGPDYVPPAK